MAEKPFSVNDALRFSRHDFLNQLQLIKMNIDLERLDDAREVITNYTEACKAVYELSNLHLPETSEWLQTANWRFPAFQVSLNTQIINSFKPEFDRGIRDTFESFTQKLHDQLSPYHENELRIWITSTEELFKITVEAVGKWNPIEEQLLHSNQLTINHECKTSEIWRFHIEESKEE